MDSDEYKPAPSISSTAGFRNVSEPQLGQPKATGESYNQPVSRSKLHLGLGKSNPDVNGYRGLDQADQAPGHDAVGRQVVVSKPDLNDADDYKPPPSASDVGGQRNISNPGGSTSTNHNAFNPHANPGMSINGRNFNHAYRLMVQPKQAGSE